MAHQVLQYTRRGGEDGKQDEDRRAIRRHKGRDSKIHTIKMKQYICYIKREDRMEEPETITVTEKELIDLIEKGEEVQGYKMDQIEMITTKED